MMVKSQDITRLENLFIEIDTNQDGRLTKAELEQYMDQFTGRTSFSEEDVESIYSSIAGPNAASISYSEFITAAMDKRTQLSEENLTRAFDMISNGESNISLIQLQEALVLEQDSQDGRLIK